MAVSRLFFGIPMDPSTTLHFIFIVGILAACLALVSSDRRFKQHRRRSQFGLAAQTFGVLQPLPVPQPLLPRQSPLFPAELTAAWKKPIYKRMSSDSGQMWAAAVRHRTQQSKWDCRDTEQLSKSQRKFLKRNHATTRIVRALAKCRGKKIKWTTHHVIYAWYHASPDGPNLIYVGKTKRALTDRLDEHLLAGANMSRGTAMDSTAAADHDSYRLYKWMGRYGVGDLVMMPLEVVRCSDDDWEAVSKVRERWWINELRSLAPHGANKMLPGGRRTRYRDVRSAVPAHFKTHAYGFSADDDALPAPGNNPNEPHPYRVHHRRIQALAALLAAESGQDALRLRISLGCGTGPYRYRSLRKCLFVARLGEVEGVRPDRQEAVVKALEEEIRQRQQQSSSRRHELRVSFDPVMERCGLSKLVTATTQHALLPTEVCNRARITLGHTYGTPIGPMLCNASQFAARRSLRELHALASGPCACASMPARFLHDCSAADPNALPGQHVWTTDPDFAAAVAPDIADEAAALVARGSKYRASLSEHASHSMRAAAVEAVKAAADRLQARLRRDYNNPALDLDPWRDRLLAALNDALDKAALKDALDEAPHDMQPDLEHPPADAPQSVAPTLKALQDAFKGGQWVITKADKASNCFAFVCPKLYAAIYLHQLHSQTANGPFSPTDLTEQEVHANIAAGIKDLGLPPLAKKYRGRLPTVSHTVKLHKLPGCETRAVTHSGKVATTPASRWLHILLKWAIRSMLARWAPVVRDHGFDPADYKPWHIKSTAEFVVKLARFNNSLSSEEHGQVPARHMDAYDVVSLFHSISQDGCRKQTRACLELLWANKNHATRLRLYDNGSAKWLAEPRPRPNAAAAAHADADADPEDSEELTLVHDHEDADADLAPDDPDSEELSRPDGQRYTPSAYSAPSSYDVDFDTAVRLVDFVLDNAYVKADKHTVLRQTGGVPMGGNASPDLANVYLGMHELDFITHLMDLASLPTDVDFIKSRLGKKRIPPPPHPELRSHMAAEIAAVQLKARQDARELLPRFRHIARYMDDVAVIDNPALSTYVHTSPDGSPFRFKLPDDGGQLDG